MDTTLTKVSALNEISINYRSREIVGISNIYIKEASQAVEVLRKIWSDYIEHREEAYVLLLNRANRVIGYHLLSSGGTASTVVDVKLLFQLLLKANASSFVLSHNHPSQNINPSSEDLKLTAKIKEASKFLEIHFLDHIILTKSHFYSLANEGLM